MTYKTYKSYKDSGINLMEKIPKCWDVFKLKFLINSLESGKRKDFEDEDYAFSLGGEHINWDGTLNLTNKRFLSKEFYDTMNSGKVETNDILLVKDGATIGKTAFVEDLNFKMAVNEHVFIIRNNKLICPKFLYYLISSSIGFSQIKLTETGSAQGGINQSIKDKVLFAIPLNIGEQYYLANYLDEKTSEIDDNIAKNKELINLLEEKKAVLINQVVTKGLNPNVSMKNSGIGWIGEIPEHWDVVLFKRLFDNIKDGTHGSFERVSEGKYLLSAKNIFNNKINISENESLISNGDYESIVSNGFPKKGDLLLTIVGTIGRSCVYEEDFPLAFQRSVAFIRLNYDNSYFFNYFVKSIMFLTQLELKAKESAQKGVYLSDIKDCFIIKPPLEEQEDIVKYLDTNVSTLEKTIEKINKQIDLLEEYKSSLIHHVVTGKIDVREEEI